MASKESTSNHHELLIAWSPPMDPCVQFNCDGAVTNCGLNAACSGVLRNSYGKFIYGFSRNLGACTITLAEL
ncbi:beta-amyrin synthase [Trifolium medium]|uniref:Beta-amyrin synthase n=1 Tax=Trifolium medium TaxID=97028 RepID=A0A392PSI1_9FABA|nr:beta-amyrin synthase [Trifolium medium]